MRVRELIELLGRFDPDAEVHLSISHPGRVIATHENVWVADYGGGPQLIAALDYKHTPVYVGCGVEQLVTGVPAERPSHVAGESLPAERDLGEYESAETAAKVRDFFNYHRRPGEPLEYPDFDYDSWIAPRTNSGEYNQHIASILEEKLLKD